MAFDYDVIILGSGPAGFSCAMQSSKFDKKVLIIEAHASEFGGTWINTGTVPSKALREAAHTIQSFTSQYGDQSKKPFDLFRMSELMDFKKKVLASESLEVKQNLEKNNIEVARGFGKLLDQHTVEITSKNGETSQATGQYILVSTGSKPLENTQIKIDHKTILNNRSILNLTHIPKRLTIIGSGINALEYATIFAALGSRVNILNEQEEAFLTFLDEEISQTLHSILKSKGIRVFNGVQISKIEYNSMRTYTEVRFSANDVEKNHVIETEKVVYFGKRVPNTHKVGLQDLGIDMDDSGYIKVNSKYQTNVPNIYASGDVIGFPALASASFNQGRMSSCHMFGYGDFELPGDIPFGIYSIPEVSSIGYTEKEAKKLGIECTVGRAVYNNVSKANISNNEHGLLKIVFENKSLKLLGVQIIGEGACDLIHLGQSVIAFEGQIYYFINHVMNHPTYSELYRVATFNGLNRLNQSGAKYKKG